MSGVWQRAHLASRMGARSSNASCLLKSLPIRLPCIYHCDFIHPPTSHDQQLPLIASTVQVW